jgi:hypothetical protein
MAFCEGGEVGTVGMRPKVRLGALVPANEPGPTPPLRADAEGGGGCL